MAKFDWQEILAKGGKLQVVLLLAALPLILLAAMFNGMKYLGAITIPALWETAQKGMGADILWYVLAFLTFTFILGALYKMWDSKI